VTSSPDLSRELPVRPRLHPSPSVPFCWKHAFWREVPAFSLPSRRCVPASSAGSGASLLPHPMDLVNPWATYTLRAQGSVIGNIPAKFIKKLYLSFFPTHPQLKLGFSGHPFYKAAGAPFEDGSPNPTENIFKALGLAAGICVEQGSG